MSYADTRELIRLRYELRKLLAERPAEVDVKREARALVDRIEALVGADEIEARGLDGELARWRVSLAL